MNQHIYQGEKKLGRMTESSTSKLHILFFCFILNFLVVKMLICATYSLARNACTHCYRFLWVSAKFVTCTVVSVNGTLIEVKMCTFTLESLSNLALTHSKRITVQYVFNKKNVQNCIHWEADENHIVFFLIQRRTLFERNCFIGKWIIRIKKMKVREHDQYCMIREVYLNQYSHYNIPLFDTIISSAVCNDSTLHSVQGYKWKTSSIKLHMEGHGKKVIDNFWECTRAGFSSGYRHTPAV